MAETVHESAFYLPSDFLTDEDFLLPPNKVFPLRATPPPPASLFRRSSSALTSPGESVVSSTDTDTSNDDPDEFIAELTRHLAHSALRDHHQKSWGVLATSPQSTLTGFNSMTNRRRMLPPAYGDEEAWELIYAAAERVAKMRMTCQAQMMKQQQQQPMRGFLGASTPPVCYTAPHNNHQFQQQMKNQQQVKHSWLTQQQMARNRGGGVFECASGRCGGHPNSCFPPLNNHRHPNGAGDGPAMRAVFLGGAAAGGGVKKQSTGTGVFLPRRVSSSSSSNNNTTTTTNNNNAPAEPRKKQGCSTVLVPARVVQALNLNIDEMNGHGHAHGHAHTHPPNHVFTDIMVDRINGVMMGQQQRRGIRGDQGPMGHHEVPLLPQEWTY